MVVEDDEAQRTAVAAVLQMERSFDVATAEDGEEALKLMRQQPPAVVVSDIYMPRLDGVELCRLVKSDMRLQEVMFILLTSSGDLADKVRGFENGADDYVTKPVHADELIARVRSSIRIKAMRDELKEDQKALAELNRTLEESYAGVLHLLVQLLGLRIPNATSRAERSEAMATWIGERLGMEGAALHVLATAAKLHEIGKISLPERLLKKEPGEWNEEERREARSFATFGYLMLSSFPKLKDVGLLIRHQLENFDGTGYPDKLLHQQIPLGSRVLRVINFVYLYPVTKARSRDQQVDSLRKARGTNLDPRIVQLAEEYLQVVEDRTWLEGKRQVGVFELQAGMILAHDLTTGGGMKLLSRDATVTLGQIERILSHHQVDPIVNSVYIYDHR
jgi:putative two-component system response regulator